MITVAISGINAIDNPGPGTGIARSLKLWAEQNNESVRIIGIAYDAMEPGIYMDWMIDQSYVMPYPSGHIENYKDRMAYIIHRENVDVWIPSLDVELPLFIGMKEDIKNMGVQVLLPSRSDFQAIQKNKLHLVAEKMGVNMPRGMEMTSEADLQSASEKYGFPMMVKGPFYEAQKVFNMDQAYKAFQELAFKWGYPILAQEYISGDEYNLIGLSDGSGEDLGHLSVKKMMVTKQGKVWTNVSIRNEVLESYVSAFLNEIPWAGGYELELIMDAQTQEFYMIEINPRFPAWVYMASYCGVNLPSRLVAKLMELPFEKDSEYDVGKMLIRYTGEMIKSIAEFEKVTTLAES